MKTREMSDRKAAKREKSIWGPNIQYRQQFGKERETSEQRGREGKNLLMI